MTSKFKIGDIIVGTEESNRYCITAKKKGFVGEVVDVYSSGYDDIKVKILENNDSREVGSYYSVRSERFELKNKTTEQMIQSIAQSLNIEKEMFLKAVKKFENNASKLEKELVDVISKMQEEKMTPNNKIRKKAIERAVKFVEENKEVTVLDKYKVYVHFVVNVEKRTVVAIGRDIKTKIIHNKAIAKCNPNDVFNANIGKAIALGRLMGVDVAEYISVPNPDSVAIGQEVVLKTNSAKRYIVTGENDNKDEKSFDLENVETSKIVWDYESALVVVNDTDAQY